MATIIERRIRLPGICSTAFLNFDLINIISKSNDMIDLSGRISIIGGTIFSIFLTLPWTDVEKTIVLSAIGTAASFFVSFLLQRVMKKWKW